VSSPSICSDTLISRLSRYNHREGFNDGQRFDLAVCHIIGKRLTWDQLTGKKAQLQQAF